MPTLRLAMGFSLAGLTFCANPGPSPVAPPVTLVVAPAASAVPVVVTDPAVEDVSPPVDSEVAVPEPSPDSPGRRDRQTRTPRMHAATLKRLPAVKWTARVGKTTFRTTMALVGDKIVLGTHGSTLGGQNERDDGVYVLEAKTGRVQLMIPTPGSGDRDVGGIAIDRDRLYFTTDNGQVVAATLGGQVLWKTALRGKVRPAPALGDLDGDGQVDVVVGDEQGTLSALDGKTGKKLWSHGGGVNDYDARGFIGGAAMADVDGDGRDDVIAGGRDGRLVAWRGRDGRELWSSAQHSGMHASPLVGDFDGSGRLEVLAAWSYGDVALLDLQTGHARWAQKIELDQAGIEGLFGTPMPLPLAQGGLLVAPTAWWGKEDGIVELGPSQRAFRTQEGRVSSTAIVGDIDGDGVPEAILGTEAGQLLALGASGSRALLATLKGPIEAPAMLADTDGDGTYELLVASNDGLLTCFTTGATMRPAASRFRGESPQNRGFLGMVKLAGWTLAP